MEAYVRILIYIMIAAGLGLLLVVLAYLRGPRRGDAQKLSAYECGFQAFTLPRHQFAVKFYLVAILFIIFDLEVALLIPWVVGWQTLGWFGYGSVMLFLFVLTVGFIYEWRQGALEWE